MVSRRAIAHLKAADPVLAAIIEQVGTPRRRQRAPTFEALARMIVFQQLHGKAAATIYERLVAKAGGELTPQSILALDEQAMRGCGLSRQKLSYIRDLAARTAAGEIDFPGMPEMTDDDIIGHLTRVKGIGTWSAQMFLMFALGRPDVMPTADFAINAAIKKHYRKRQMPKPKVILKIAECWRPFRTIACYYLWESLDIEI